MKSDGSRGERGGGAPQGRASGAPTNAGESSRGSEGEGSGGCRGERAEEDEGNWGLVAEVRIRDSVSETEDKWPTCFEIRLSQVSSSREGLTTWAYDPGRIGFSPGDCIAHGGREQDVAGGGLAHMPSTR